MSFHYPPAKFEEVAKRVATPTLRGEVVREEIDRSFGLPRALHLATFGLYFGFLTVMSLGFGTRELAVPLAICFIFLFMAAAVPAKWVMMKPAHRAQPLSWIEFEQHGVDTLTGRMTAKDAMGQVLILPILIFFWGVAIIAFVSLV